MALVPPKKSKTTKPNFMKFYTLRVSLSNLLKKFELIQLNFLFYVLLKDRTLTQWRWNKRFIFGPRGIFRIEKIMYFFCNTSYKM